MKKLLTIIFIAGIFLSCRKPYEVIMPDTSNWNEFNNSSAKGLQYATRSAMEGIYNLSKGNDVFGDMAAIKWNFTVNGRDTNFHVSGFFGVDIAYFICEGKRVNGSILMNGYWRKMVSTETGVMRLRIDSAGGAPLLLNAGGVVAPGSVSIKGVFSYGPAEPVDSVTLVYSRQLNKKTANFQILAHRSGGRTSDLLPVSENSVDMILKTPEFGSTGIEIDIQFTKDGVPILYHDNTINLRETQKSGLIGPIKNYTYEQLSTFVRLIHGEKIPTLKEALDAVVYKTDLRFVWLDTKFVGSIAPVAAVQKEYLRKAAAQGRQLEIVIGLPGQAQVDNFLALPDYNNTPSLCELSLDDFTKTNAKIWAPRFTEGNQNDKVALVHAAGKRAFVWTVDVPDFINRFVTDANFDGILSNFPSAVAYNYYTYE